MATSTFSDPIVMTALGCAAGSVLLLVWHLARRPAITTATKLALLFGIGVLPLVTAGIGNYAGFEATKQRSFCGSCHVMTPYLDDALSPESLSLAARHNRNEHFGHESCYTCHADYGMFGTIVTKMGGMGHVYEYVIRFHKMSFDEALPHIVHKGPYRNDTCLRCHSTKVASFLQVGDHVALIDEIRASEVSCFSEGCHGPPHPFKGKGGK